MRIIRAATESEVIAEFLRNEFHQQEYHRDRHQYERIVFAGDLHDEQQNEIRRELLFRRHRVIWRELPANIQWFRTEIDAPDLDRVRVFPRGHWPKMTDGDSFAVTDMVASIRAHHFSSDTSDDVAAIHALAYRYRKQLDDTSILLIGIDEGSPLTILEGNHRMIAAAIASRDRISSLRIFSGFSPQMQDCFWYRTTPDNFIRHAVRRVRDLQPGFTTRLKDRWATLFSRAA